MSMISTFVFVNDAAINGKYLKVPRLLRLRGAIGSLPCFDNATSYAKQKDSLQKAVEKFLLSIPGSPILATMAPRDICRFLVLKDEDGKTQVHRNG